MDIMRETTKLLNISNAQPIQFLAIVRRAATQLSHNYRADPEHRFAPCTLVSCVAYDPR